jgi:hypothetical protein
MKEANNSGASGVILHVYEDHYPSCFFMRIRSGREYKPEGFKKNAKGKWVVDNTLDHGKDSSSHFDPEWKHLTYGEVPFENPKACMRKLKRGDYIFFNCNLRRCKSKSNFSRCTKRGKVSWPSCEDKGEKSWYIIGFSD